MERRLLGASCGTNPNEIEFALGFTPVQVIGKRSRFEKQLDLHAPVLALDILPAAKELANIHVSISLLVGSSSARPRPPRRPASGARTTRSTSASSARRPRHGHLRTYSKLPEARVVALCDVNQAARERAQATLRRIPARRLKNLKTCARRSRTRRWRRSRSRRRITGTPWRPSGR